MILLDTNVVSEPLRIKPEPSVLAWIDLQNIETLYLSAISVAELRFGIAALPKGKRRDLLSSNFEKRVLPLFNGRILSFDLAASQSYVELRAAARREGKEIGVSDGYIAAIAASNGLVVATRDTAPFVAAGVGVIDPWA
jgi:toxin FitB